MRFILNFFYLSYIVLSLPYYLFKFLTSKTARLGLTQRFGGVPQRTSAKPAIWLHCASVGEFLAIQDLITAIEKDLPNHEIIVSTLTPTAYQLARARITRHQIVFWPIDLSWITRKVLKRLRPDLIVLIEQEIWPNFIDQAQRLQIPIILINGRITERSLRRYRSVNWLIKPTLQKIKMLGVQTEEYAQRYRSLGVAAEKITVTGNLKYDIKTEETAPEEYSKLFRIKSDDIVMVGGSTHHPEEEVLVDSYLNLRADIKNLKLILAPRHPERTTEVEKYIQSKNISSVKRSQLSATDELAPDVIIIDTLGELNKLYPLATIVFIGGSLIPRGGQNVLEPAAAGRPVLFGPYMYNFQEAADLLVESGAGWMVQNAAELESQLRSLLANRSALNEAGQAGQKAIRRHRGATDRNFEVIRESIS